MIVSSSRGTDPRIVSHLAICSKNNLAGRSDATGAFIPGAKRFGMLHGSPHVVQLDMSGRPVERKARFMETLNGYEKVETLAIFCHGFSNGLQCGIYTRDMPLLAAELKRLEVKTAILYACSTAKNKESGFATTLAKATGCRVLAHTTAGHAITNPYLVEITPENGCRYIFPPPSSGLIGDLMVVTKKRWARWLQAVKKPGSFLPYMIGSLSYDDLRKAVLG